MVEQGRKINRLDGVGQPVDAYYELPGLVTGVYDEPVEQFFGIGFGKIERNLAVRFVVNVDGLKPSDTRALLIALEPLEHAQQTDYPDDGRPARGPHTENRPA